MYTRPLTALLLGASLALVACGDKDTEGTQDTGHDHDADTDTDADADADADTDADTDTDVDPLDSDDDGDGFTENEGDCNDDEATANPDGTEVEGNGIDEDCDGFTITVDMTCHGVDADEDGSQDAVGAVRIVGPWWNGWDPVAGPSLTDNGDGTWSVLFEEPPTEAMEYLFSINETPPYENLIDDAAAGGTCAPITDAANYANRQWNPGDGDVSATYASCDPCGG